MSLTVRELIAIPTLKTRVLAGQDGLDRKVQWAHSCELQEPWHWLGPGDLLMTVGHGLPADEHGQQIYLRELANAGLSGVALAEGMFAPELTDGARETADQLAFPVLETGYEIPFVSLARTVADSNQRESYLRLSRVLRVYDAFRLAMSDAAADETLFSRIGGIVEARMGVIDVVCRCVEVSGGLMLDDVALAEILRRVDEYPGRLPAVMRANVGERRFVIQPLPGPSRWMLVTEVDNQIIDLAVLEHVATIMLIQLERRRSVDLARLHSGGRLLTNLLQGRADPGLAAAELEGLGLPGPPWRLSMVWDREVNDLIALQRLLLAAEVKHVLEKVNDRLVILTSDAIDPSLIAEVTTGDALGHIGVSDAVNSLSRLPEAIREARWALETSARGEGVQTSPASSLFLPRTVSEGQAAVTRTLGPLLEYDATHDSNLVESLEVFFSAERSWQAAAERLCVHKQTLIYRMHRVEEITGRQLSRLDDVAELHLALRTRAMLRGQ